ncbi:uncharacterized protein LOC128033724 [Gossypium raimondii]|uniref:uncharacterized protein LOC128033724 n=1 Tax=Gossypium raimondii TaxID=29730 RepID=UPI00227D19DE|nr:uncharacterized protein LOC128033724 [Gossypium raimondii]
MISAKPDEPKATTEKLKLLFITSIKNPAEELRKEKRKADYEARDSCKRSFSKSFQSASRKSREDHSRSKATAGFPKHDRDRPLLHDRSCFKCGSKDHFIRECPMVADQNTMQNTRPSNMSVRGRSRRHLSNVSGSQRGTKDTAVRSEARAPARAYAIRARKEASSPDVITVFSKTLPVESTEFVIKVSNPLGRCVLVDKVCKNCPLMIRDLCFTADLMLLPFDEFDIILGMDWLTLHDAVVNCKRKTIDLRYLNDEIIRIESNDLNGLSAVISSMLAQKYNYRVYHLFEK